MSQEKVNQYKQEKANRKDIVKKQKRNKKLLTVLWIVIAILLVGGIGYGIYVSIQNKNETPVTDDTNGNATSDYQKLLDYLQQQGADVQTSEDGTPVVAVPSTDGADNEADDTTDDSTNDTEDTSSEDTTE